MNVLCGDPMKRTMDEEIASKSEFLSKSLNAYRANRMEKYSRLSEECQDELHFAITMAFLEGSGVWLDYDREQRRLADEAARIQS